ncbi:hypothetical protein WN944_003114 [Citrus x changshan-huyou]|uniref:Uncharacterized protein n=1 Tax=Citrus x changshan-huyou TaxID=2935761 RepID=A0AAP0M2J7_9ROSI
MLIVYLMNFFHRFVSLNRHNKESTFSEVDGFEDGDKSNIHEEVSESGSEEKEDVKLATLRNRTYATAISTKETL